MRVATADSAVAASPAELHPGLLRMREQKLNGSEIPGSPVDQRCLGASHECVPQAAGSNPIDLTQVPTIREYCRVERWGDSDTRLDKRCCPGLGCAEAIHMATASRV